MLLFVIHHLWSIIGDSGFVVSLILPQLWPSSLFTGRPESWDRAPTLAEALALVDTTGERWYEPEMYRLKGALLLQQSSDNQADAETCFHKAITVAQTQQAK